MKRFTLLALAALTASCTTDVGNESLVANTEKSPVAPWEQYLLAEVSSSLIDFSAAGVNYSESGIPELSLPVFSVTEYGAMANDGLEDKEAIQQAINAAEKAGGGIVHFPSGRFLINEQKNSHSIVISSSRVILQGSGNGKSGTELFMKQPLEPLNSKRTYSVPAMIKFMPKNASDPSNDQVSRYMAKSVITQNAQQNDTSVEVLHPQKFKAGDMVTIDMQSLAANAEFLHGKKPRFNWQEINTKGVQVSETLEVVKVEGSRVFFKQSLLTNINAAYGWTIRSLPSLTNVGIENLRFTGDFHEKFVHHKSAYHDSGFNPVKMINTRHSWVRNVAFVNVSRAATVVSGIANSMMLNVIEGNRGHGSFDIRYGTRNLIALNVDVTNKGQWHGPGASHLSVGNVIWRFNSPQSRGIDAHGVFPRFTLFDNITTKGFGGWGGNYKNLPNHLEGMVFWNFKQTGGEVGAHYQDKFNFWDVDVPKNKRYTFLTAVNPILVGYEGSAKGYLKEHTGYVKSFGKNVQPTSLYETQLIERLGKQPSWVKEGLLSWEQILVNYAL